MVTMTKQRDELLAPCARGLGRAVMRSGSAAAREGRGERGGRGGCGAYERPTHVVDGGRPARSEATSSRRGRRPTRVIDEGDARAAMDGELDEGEGAHKRVVDEGEALAHYQ